MKKLSLLLILLISVIAYSQTRVYESPNLKQKIKIHKKVAILPFDSNITYKKKPEKYDSLAIRDHIKNISRDSQEAAFNFLLSKSKYLTVEIQDIEKTNNLLKKAGYLDKLDDISKQDLAKLLDVDAVVTGKFDIEITKSDVMGMATGLLFSNGSTGTGALTMKIYDGSNDDMLWNFYYSKSDSFAKSSKELIEQLMKKVANVFPYRKYR